MDLEAGMILRKQTSQQPRKRHASAPVGLGAMAVALCTVLAGCSDSKNDGGQGTGTLPTAGAVSISGTWAVGSTLTAVPSGFGLGTPEGGYHFAWQRCPDESCTSAAGVGTDAPTYTLVAADVGSYVRVGAFVTNACASGCGSSATEYSSAAIVPGTAPTAGTVSISGTWAVGSTVTAEPSGYTLGTPAGSYHYEWQSCPDQDCITPAAVGTDAPTYALAAGDVDSYVRVGINASNACTSGCGSSATVFSAAAIVPGAAPAAGTVSISGSRVEGFTLTAEPAGFDLGTPAGSYHYEWQRCPDQDCTSTAAVGTDSPVYALVAGDVGSFVRVGVHAFNACASGCGSSPTVFSSAAIVLAPGCGNAAREPGEQCDDGNLDNLDGCDGTCRFEQVHRVNSLQVQFAPGTFCPANAFGSAFVGGTARSLFQSYFDAAIGNGSTSLVWKFLDLDDLAGAGDPQVRLGALGGTHVTPGSTSYNGNSDLDWWYTSDPSLVDASRNPTLSLEGSIDAGVLTAGPGRVDFALLATYPFHLSNARISATVGAPSAPLVSADGLPPGHLASEHLDPALTSFATTGDGQLCGGLIVAGLAEIPIFPNVPNLCPEYTLANSLLDLVVGGCIFAYTYASPTQPDTVDPDAPAAGAGGPYTLSGSAGMAIDRCTDKDGVDVPLDACLASAAYSSYFRFTTDRVVAK